MNFVCDKCKQKYHVADEKIRGRAVTRFRCKKCENVIELRADALPDPDAPDAPKQAAAPDDRPRPATMAPSSPRPAVTAISGGAAGTPSAPKAPGRQRAPTSVGVAFNAGMAATAAKPAPRTASTSAILNASETGWYAGIRDLPVGPLTRKELVAKVQSAEVTPDTLVWREGLDDWRPLRNVAELGDVLRLGAQRISGNLLDEMGRRSPTSGAPAAPAEPRRSGQVVPLRQPLATPSAPAATRASVADDDDEATRVTGMDPAIAALVPKALGLDRPKAPEDDGGDHTLVEAPVAPVARTLGLDGKAGAKAPLKAPPPKAPMPAPTPGVRPAPPKAPTGFAQQKPAPAPPPSPAPPPPAVESAPPPAAALTVESSPSLAVSSMPAPVMASSIPAAAASSVPPPADDDLLPDDLFGKKPLPPQSKAPSLESFGLSAAFTSGPPPGASMPAPVLSPVGSFQPAPVPATQLAPSVPVPPPRPAGLSAPVIILMIGVLVLGVFGGVVLAGRLNRPIPQPVPPPVPVVMPTAPAPAPAPAAPAPETVAAAPEPTPNAAEPTTEPETPGSSGHRHHSPSTPREAPGTISAAQAAANAAALRNALGNGGGPSGGPVTTPRSSEPGSASAQSSGSGPALSGAARAGRAVQNFSNARIVNTCWQTLLRLNPSVQPVRVTITLQIGSSGRLTGASVSNSPDPRFSSCISQRVGSVAPVSPGEPSGAELSVNLTTGG